MKNSYSGIFCSHFAYFFIGAIDFAEIPGVRYRYRSARCGRVQARCPHRWSVKVPGS